MKTTSSFPGFVFLVTVGIGSVLAFIVSKMHSSFAGTMVLLLSIIVAALVFASIRVADEWKRGVVLRLGRFRGLKGPGVFFILPIIESIPCWIDTRVLTSAFKAEKTFTKDTVPVDVDAVLFWKIADPKRAVLDVADYHNAIACVAQTALRDIIGKTTLHDMLEGRDRISGTLQQIIAARSEAWGIQVVSVDVKDILMASALYDAISMRAVAMFSTGTDIDQMHAQRADATNSLSFAAAGEQDEEEPQNVHDLLQPFRPTITRANLIRSAGSASS